LLHAFGKIAGKLLQNAGEVVLGGLLLGFALRLVDWVRCVGHCCVGYGCDQAGGISCSQWRMMATASFGFLSARSPTFFTDCAWTSPWIWAMSIILAAKLGLPASSSLRSEAERPGRPGVPGRNSAPGNFGASGVTMRRTSGRTTNSRTTRLRMPITV